MSLQTSTSTTVLNKQEYKKVSTTDKLNNLLGSNEHNDIYLEQACYRFYSGFVFVSSILNVFHLIIGFFNLKNCTIRPIIPIWLIILGSIGIFNAFFTLIGLHLKYVKILFFLILIYLPL